MESKSLYQVMSHTLINLKAEFNSFDEITRSSDITPDLKAEIMDDFKTSFMKRVADLEKVAELLKIQSKG